jgi:hypothetical protein
MVARAMTVVLCLALAVSGVPHNAADAAEHAGSDLMVLGSTDLANDVGDDINHALADFCSVADGCHSGIAVAQTRGWPAFDGGAAPIMTGDRPNGRPGTLHERPPKSLA